MGRGAQMRPDPIKPGATALVTGGASGIGWGLTQAFLESGMKVVVTDVREDHLATARRALEDHEDQVWVQALDVADRKAWSAVLDGAEDRFGPLHVVCLNAGVGLLGTILDASAADWDWLMRVNLAGVANGVSEALPRVRAHGEPGHVVATSSMGGLIVANDGGIYSSGKFGVVAMMETLRLELSGGPVSASVLCPAAVNTNIFDHARMRPETAGVPGVQKSAEELAEDEARAKFILSQGRTPIEVGRLVREAIRRDDPYIFTDGAVRPFVERRRDALVRACGASNHA